MCILAEDFSGDRRDAGSAFKYWCKLHPTASPEDRQEIEVLIKDVIELDDVIKCLKREREEGRRYSQIYIYNEEEIHSGYKIEEGENG